MDALSKYDFPGNVRELANLIERLVVLAENDRIELKDLPDSIANYMSKTIAHPLLSEGIPLKEALEKYERLIIERAIRKYGSQDEVARILKVDQGTISRKVKKYSLVKKDVIMHK
jgi:transcriptional regulator with PAS, ATPase and Fis domain